MYLLRSPRTPARIASAITGGCRVLYGRVIFPTTAITCAVFLNYFVQINYGGAW